jgi:murein DD-endopeptidase MepM/ murein hydrolase activator NlpD
MGAATRKRRGWRKLIGIAIGSATMSLGAGVAAGSSGGGITPSDPAELTDVTCIEKCAGERKATEGSIVRLSGSNLDEVDEVKFAGEHGRIAVEPISRASGEVEAKVPEGAATGTVQVSAPGAEAETPRDEPLQIVAESQIPEGGSFKLSSAAATPRNTFYDGAQPPSVAYLFQGSGSTDVRIEVVDRGTRETVASWVERNATPNNRNVATWDGRTDAGALAANGDYMFRIGSLAGGKAQATEESRFGYHRWRFPIAARHSYGDGFGAGRDHEGQDVFAKCGTPLLAARGGRVKLNDSHSAAGNYLVIDGKGTGMDFMYAHLARRSPLRRGARVHTGERIGLVGQTGNASGCHLHFEAWSAPGYYDGGHALPSVASLLKTWDRWS